MYPKSLSADAASWLQSWFCYFLVNEFTEMESVNRSSVPNQRRDIGAASHIFEDRCRLRSTWPEPGSNESWSDQYPVSFKTVNQSSSGFRAAKEREKHLTVWWYRQEGQGWLAVAEAATKKKSKMSQWYGYGDHSVPRTGKVGFDPHWNAEKSLLFLLSYGKDTGLDRK